MSGLATSVTLGPVTFESFEVPAEIRFGGAQRLAVHQLPGGARLIDAMGPEEAMLTFSGVLSGPSAELRALTLDALRAAGLVLPFSFGLFAYSVVIAEFLAAYQSAAWIPYRLALLVVSDAASVIAEAADLSTTPLGDLATAAAFAPAGIDFTPAQSALAAPGATTLGTSAYQSATSALASLQQTLSGAIASQSSAQAALAAPLAGTDPAAGAAALNAAASTSGALAQLQQAQNYAGRAGVLLAAASP
jgi:hypothetical protein